MDQQTVWMELQALNPVVRKKLAFVASEKDLDKFFQQLGLCLRDVPVPLDYVDEAWAELKSTFTSTKKGLLPLQKEGEARIELFLGRVKKVVHFILDTETYKGVTVYTVDNLRSVPALSLPTHKKPCILLSPSIPPALKIPVLEHEWAEYEHIRKTGGWDIAHDKFGVPAGRKKAEELGVLEAFLEYEKMLT